MKNVSLKSFTILSVLLLTGNFYIASAQTTSVDIKKETKVEISLPIQKDDFLLFYGVTDNTEINAELLNLRKDFIVKFEELKSDYKKSFNNIVAGAELKPGVEEEKVESTTLQTPLKASVNTRSIQENTKTAKEITANINNDVKKYIIKDTKDNIINPIVNILNDKASIKIETSS